MKWSKSNVIATALVVLIGGAVTALFAMLAWADWVALQNQRRVVAAGVEAPAELTGARLWSRRGDTRYLVNAMWKDHKGAIRMAHDVNVSKTFFGEAEAGRKTARLKYLPAEPRIEPVFTDDAATLDSQRIWKIQGRFVALLFGFAAGAFVLWGWHRRASSRAA